MFETGNAKTAPADQEGGASVVVGGASATDVSTPSAQSLSAGLGHLDISAAHQVSGGQMPPSSAPAQVGEPSSLSSSQSLTQLDDPHSNRESENESSSTIGREERKRKPRTKRRKTVDKSPSLTLLSYEVDELECLLELPNRNAVTFKFAIEIDKPEEIAESLVSEDLLQEVQSLAVIALLRKAVAMVKEDHTSAMSITLTMIDTPTSSPTSQRKSLPGKQHETSDAAKKLHFDSDTQDEMKPMIAIKTRHPSGENKAEQNKATGQAEPTRVIESKRRSFIVSRVQEHSVISDKINEDDTEEATQGETSISPDSTHSTLHMGSASAQAQTLQSLSEADSCMSDSERSTKSIGRGTKEVPVNIVDLNEKLVKLTGGNIAQLDSSISAASTLQVAESQSPVPSEDGNMGSQMPLQVQPQQTPQAQPPQQPSQQQQQSSAASGTDKPAQIHESSSVPHAQMNLPPIVDNFPQQPHTMSLPPNFSLLQQQTPKPQQQSQTTAMLQGQGIMPQPPMQTPNPSQPAQPTSQSHSTPAPVNQPGQDTSGQHMMNTGMYPQTPGMSYFPMMQQPFFMHQQHQQHPHGMMPMYGHPEQMYYSQYGQFSNNMVPYVMVNVQQQHHVTPMLVPANIIMNNQGFMQMQQGHQYHQEAQHQTSITESVISSPPGSPLQNRKQQSIDMQSESGTSGVDLQSPSQNRVDNSIAHLEQELIKKLHGGTRKDIPMSSGGSVLSESFSQSMPDVSSGRLSEDKPQWHQSAENLSITEETTEDKTEDKAEELDESSHTLKEDNDEKEVKLASATPVVKKLRFQVSKVSNDPLKTPQSTEEEGKGQSVVEKKDSDEQTPVNTVTDTDTTKDGKSMADIAVTEDEAAQAAAKPKGRVGRFSVSKVKDSKEVAASETGAGEDKIDGALGEEGRIEAKSAVEKKSDAQVALEKASTAEESQFQRQESVCSDSDDHQKEYLKLTQDPEYQELVMKHSKELEELQKLHRSELEKFLKRKGYKMPASPLISTAPGNLSAGPILSPLNMTSIQSISSIPNPPPMPNPSLMSIQVPDNYPAIFSMAQRQPPSCKSASSFKDELFRCVESFTARSQANLLHSSGAAISQAGSRPFPAGVISHMSQTMTTDSEGRSRSPRVSSTCDVSRDNGSRRSSIDSEEVVTQSPIIHPNHPFIMQQPMYNFHYSDGSFMPAMAPGYSGAPFVEAGLPQPIRVTQYPPVSFLQPTSTQASSSATDVAPSGSQSQSKT